MELQQVAEKPTFRRGEAEIAWFAVKLPKDGDTKGGG
jgi:hypothetical protein